MYTLPCSSRYPSTSLEVQEDSTQQRLLASVLGLKVATKSLLEQQASFDKKLEALESQVLVSINENIASSKDKSLLPKELSVCTIVL